MAISKVEQTELDKKRAAEIRKQAQDRAKLIQQAASKGKEAILAGMKGSDVDPIAALSSAAGLLPPEAQKVVTALSNIMKAGDDVSASTIIDNIISALPADAQKAAAIAKGLKDAFDKSFPKGVDGDFSTAGSIRGALGLMGQFGGKDLKKILEAREKALQLAAKLGITIPSIEDLVDFDWNTLSEKLKDFDVTSLLDVKTLLNSLEGELMKFLPPGMDKSIAALKSMLAEFGLPTSFGDAYDSIMNPVDPPVPAPADQNVYQPGVFVDTHFMARVGLSFMSHGALPLMGPGAKTVFIENMPVWRAVLDLHTCAVPVMAAPAPDGPGFCKKGYPKVLVEFAHACRHDIDAIDSPICGPTNLFRTESLAKSDWKKIQASMTKPNVDQPAAAKPTKGTGTTGGGGDGKDPEQKPKDGDSKDLPPVARFTVIEVDSGKVVGHSEGSIPLVIGTAYKAVSTSYDPDDAPAGSNNEGIASLTWYFSGVYDGGTFGETTWPLPSISEEGQRNLSLQVTDGEGLSSPLASASLLWSKDPKPLLVASFSATSGSNSAEATSDLPGKLILQAKPPQTPGLATQEAQYSLQDTSHFRTPDGEKVQHTPIHPTFSVEPGHYKLMLFVTPPAPITLKVTSDDGQSATAVLDLIGSLPSCALTGIRKIGIDSTAVQHEFGKYLKGQDYRGTLNVIGDKFEVSASCSSSVGTSIVGFGVAVVQQGSRPTEVTYWKDGAGGNLDFAVADSGNLSIYPVCLDAAGFFSEWGSPVDLYINQEFTLVNVIKATVKCILQVGLEVAITLLLGFINGGLAAITAPAALAAGAIYIVGEALKELRVPLVFRIAISGALGLTAGISAARQEVARDMEAEGRKALADVGSDVWRAGQLNDVNAMREALLRQGKIQELLRENAASSIEEKVKVEIRGAIVGAAVDTARSLVD